MFLLAALSDDAQAVVVEVFEAAGAAPDEFHVSVEALGDAVVSGKAPYGNQGLSPSVEGRVMLENANGMEPIGDDARPTTAIYQPNPFLREQEDTFEAQTKRGVSTLQPSNRSPKRPLFT